jgi:D-glycero-D-manno-heptose 1,7-bisphosphate phosphatase
MEAVERFHTTMRQKLSEQGSPDIAAWYVCPHLPDATVEACRVDCDCRKPRPGLLLRAAQDLNIDLKQSWMIGDKESDVGCGLSAGLKGTVQVTGDTNYPLHSKASWHCNTILEAARWIGSQVQQGY